MKNEGKWKNLGELLNEYGEESNRELSRPRLRMIEQLMKPGKYDWDD